MYFSRVRIRSGLNEISELARILSHNSHGVHRLLWKLFPKQKQRNFLYREEIAGDQLGYYPGVSGEPVYYLVSQTKPVVVENSIFDIKTKAYQPRLETGQLFSFECRVNPVITKKGKKHDVVMNTQLAFLMSLIDSCNLADGLLGKMKKENYKQLLLSRGGEVFDRLLSERLINDPRYFDRPNQESTLPEKLECAIKGDIDMALENWWKRQGLRCRFEPTIDSNGLCKLQNTAYRWHALPEKTKNAGFSSVDLTGELQITDIECFKKTLFYGLGRSKAFGCGLLMIRFA